MVERLHVLIVVLEECVCVCVCLLMQNWGMEEMELYLHPSFLASHWPYVGLHVLGFKSARCLHSTLIFSAS